MAVSYDGGLYVAGEKVVTESEHRRVVGELQAQVSEMQERLQETQQMVSALLQSERFQTKYTLVFQETVGAQFNEQLGVLNFSCAGNPTSPHQYRFEWENRFIEFAAPRCIFGAEFYEDYLVISNVTTNTAVDIGYSAYFCKACHGGDK
eukprot:gene29624-36911_t